VRVRSCGNQKAMVSESGHKVALFDIMTGRYIIISNNHRIKRSEESNS
jgi:hypothetical protein